MIGFILSLFGYCSHPNISWPIKMGKDGPTTTTCLKCGKRMEYDFSTMQTGEEVE